MTNRQRERQMGWVFERQWSSPTRYALVGVGVVAFGLKTLEPAVAGVDSHIRTVQQTWGTEAVQILQAKGGVG